MIVGDSKTVASFPVAFFLNLSCVINLIQINIEVIAIHGKSRPGPVYSYPFFKFGYSNSKVINVNFHLTKPSQAIVSTTHFFLLVKKALKQGCSYNLSRASVELTPIVMQNFIVWRDGCVDDIENVRLPVIENLRTVSLLILDVHFNVGKILRTKDGSHE